VSGAGSEAATGSYGAPLAYCYPATECRDETLVGLFCRGHAPVTGPYSIGSDHWPGVSKVLEECGELGQVLGKLLALNGATAHWDGSDLRLRLVEEVADVYAALDFLCEANGLDRLFIDGRVQAKRALFRRWHQEQGATAKGRRSDDA
jgi:hypothetical protein